MIEDKSVLDLQYKSIVGDNDSVVSDVGSVVSRIKISTLKGLLGQWNNINNKPFNTLNTTYIVSDNNQLSLSTNVINKLHTHSNKDYLDKISENSSGEFTYNGSIVSGVSDWDDITNKPFDDLSNDFTVTSGTVSISTDITNQLHTHSNKTVIDKLSDNNGDLYYDGNPISGSGLDFSALTDALTTGTLTGLTITADTTNENFDITVTGLPTIAIDASGYWTIDGVSTGQKAQGDDGATPTINVSDKHWYVDGVDTGVVAEGQDGVSPTATVTEDSTKVTVTITDSNGTTTADIPKVATNVDIIKGRVNTVADLSNVSNPYEGLVYLVGETSATVFDKYIYVSRDNISRWEVLGGGLSGNYIEEDVVTNVFDSASSYAVNDYVMYNNQLYKCIVSHTGAWNASHFELTTILECISTGGLNIVDTPSAQDIADSIATIWGS